MTPFQQQIVDVLAAGPLTRRALMYRIYPPDKFPRSYRHASHGGSPGCVMTFGRALGQLVRLGAINVVPGDYGQMDMVSIKRVRQTK